MNIAQSKNKKRIPSWVKVVSGILLMIVGFVYFIVYSINIRKSQRIEKQEKLINEVSSKKYDILCKGLFIDKGFYRVLKIGDNFKIAENDKELKDSKLFNLFDECELIYELDV